MDYQRRINPEARQLMYDADHDIYIDQTKIKTTANISNDLYLNCDECDDWLRTPNDVIEYNGDFPNSMWHEISIPACVGRPRKLDTPLENLPNEVNFDEKCGIDARWFIAFSERKFDFYHVMIRHQVWEKFRARIRASGQGTYHFLPYWCLCNGGNYNDFSRVHRHMIVATKTNITGLVHGLRDWLVDPLLTKRGSQSKLLDSYAHFMNAVRYVSNRSSHCEGVDMTKDSIVQFENSSKGLFSKNVASRRNAKRPRMGRCHFYIARRIVPCGLELMSLLDKDGLSAMSNINNGGVGIIDLLSGVSDLQTRKSVSFADIYSKRGHVLPLNYEHSNEYTNFRIELGENSADPGKYVVRCYNLRSIGTFENKKYAENGSLMMEASLETMHKFTAKQLGVTKPIGRLRGKYEELLRKKDEIIKEKNDIISNQAIEIRTLKRRLHD
ncbi:MAG: hypothetical protein EHM79_00970 [Geobacter sp.]|nr:MAG: hypothetical protein EHM79_00970 [Geobacter sp.]